jgi:hypothetical protein
MSAIDDFGLRISDCGFKNIALNLFFLFRWLQFVQINGVRCQPLSNGFWLIFTFRNPQSEFHNRLAPESFFIPLGKALPILAD